MSLPLSKFNFSEGCDKLKDQYNLLSLQFNNLKNESERLRNEKTTVSRHYGFLEGLKRINLACNNMLPHLLPELQGQMNQIIDYIKQLTNNDSYISSLPNGDSAVRIPHPPANGSVGDNPQESASVPNDNTGEENLFENDPNDSKHKPPDSVFGSKKYQPDGAPNNEVTLSTDTINENGTSSTTKREAPNNYNNMIMPNPGSNSGYASASGIGGHFPTPYNNGDHHSQSLSSQPSLIPPPSLPVNAVAMHTRSPSMGFGMVPPGAHPGAPVLAGTNIPMVPPGGGRMVGPPCDSLRYGHAGPYRHPYSCPGNALPPHHHTAAHTPASVTHPRISQSQKTSPLPTEYNLPKAFSEVSVLPHGDVVCTVTTTNDRLAITGGKGSVKIWDIGKLTANVELVGSVDCLVDKYIRSCKTTPDRKVVVAGEANYITMFDLGLVRKAQTLIGPKNLTQLENNTNACYALALSPDGRLCYGGCSNGFVTIWDIISNKIVRAFYAHTDGISCLDISPDGTKLFTGSLDRSTKAWDIRDSKLLEHYTYNAQVYAIASVPNNDWICAGLENSMIDVTSKTNERFELELHKSSVLSLRVAPTYDWMVSVGKDNIVNCIRTPYGPPVYQIIEGGSVLCCDISPDSKWAITGSSDRKATIYELQY